MIVVVFLGDVFYIYFLALVHDLLFCFNLLLLYHHMMFLIDVTCLSLYLLKVILIIFTNRSTW